MPNIPIARLPEPQPCSSCPAMIIFVQSAKSGHWQPLDSEPVPEGNILIIDGKAHVMCGDLFEAMHSGPRYRSHFMTCPAARDHRKPKAGKGK